MQDILVQVRGLSKEFRLRGEVVYALKDIDLDIYTGEYLSIMGPSGSGKSTLFNMVGGLDRPSRGSVEVTGIRLGDLTPRQLAYFRGNEIGYVFQSYNLLPAYGAIMNVSMPLLFSGQSPEQAARRATEVLERVGLGDRVDHRPDELSGGQQQRVAIARALANSPSIILADEPTANLDLETGRQIIDLLASLSREFGVTVISATHDHQMLAASDRILWIKDGAVDRLERREDLDIQVGSIEDDAADMANP
jgi:putative ABC transport system ATP-binding protein